MFFGLLQFEDYILKLIIKSGFTKSAAVSLLIYLVTLIISFHSLTILCLIIKTNIYVLDFIIPILLTVLFSKYSNLIYRHVETYKVEIKNFIFYFVTNYKKENITKWKRLSLLILTLYLIIVLSIVKIDNKVIFFNFVQTLISFVICDLIDNFKYRMRRITHITHITKVPIKIENDLIIEKPPTPPCVEIQMTKTKSFEISSL